MQTNYEIEYDLRTYECGYSRCLKITFYCFFRVIYAVAGLTSAVFNKQHGDESRKELRLRLTDQSEIYTALLQDQMSGFQNPFNIEVWFSFDSRY